MAFSPSRGAGTSIAGNAVGPGVVVDTSRYLDRVLRIDPEARTATVEPGLVQAALQTAARPHGLRFGPDPSTHNRCTVGGMIGNNACGSRALAYGRTADNVTHLDVVTGSGTRLYLGADGTPAPALDPAGPVVDGVVAPLVPHAAAASRTVPAASTRGVGGSSSAPASSWASPRC